MKISGIYKIQSIKKPERCYIGSAVSISVRWCQHLRELRKNKHANGKLQNHFNKYGEVDFQFSVLLGCEKEDLIKNEQYFIDSYKSWFNICPKAGSMLGTKQSEKTKKRLSEIRKTQNPWPIGSKHSDESKRRWSIVRTGKTHSEETKSKMSESHKGKNTWMKGRKLSEETKAKMKESHIGKNTWMVGKIPWNKGKKGVYSDETIEKISNANKNRKPISEETRKKMSDSHIGIPTWNSRDKKVS